MNDDNRILSGLTAAEEELAGRLARLGTVMEVQERAEADLDPAFARTLRAHLVLGEERAPHPGFARTLRARLIGTSAHRPLPKRRPVAWLAASALTVLAAVLLAVNGPWRAHTPGFGAPYPTTSELTFSFPAPLTVIHRLVPTLSLVHPRPGVPYAGHLQLNVRRLAPQPAALPAYRLAPPTDVTAGSALLDIHARVRRATVGSAVWEVAADGGAHHPLHSLAVSLATGELIYHDRRNLALPRAAKPLARGAAVAIARRWLNRLGWPGSRMPLIAVEDIPNVPKVWEVEFGWAGVGAVATDAATLWVTPNRSVIEAWVWPPVVRVGTVPARPALAAWTDVRQGRAPLAVEGVPPATGGNGTGVVRWTAVVSVLAGNHGALYLVPVYRFSGRAQISRAGLHPWYALAPGGIR